jgi:hypothetical protein
MLYLCYAFHTRRRGNLPILVAGIFMPVAAVDTRFRTPVGNVNASPASVECYATGKAEPFFYSRLS